MSQQEMKIKVELPEWNKLSKPQQSLVSFFIENSCAFIQGHFSGYSNPWDTLLFISAGISDRNKYACVSYDSLMPSFYILFDEQTTPKTFNSTFYYSDNLPAIESKLIKYNTFLSIYCYSYIDGDLVGFVPLDNFAIPAIVTPLINGQENEDESLIPIFYHEQYKDCEAVSFDIEDQELKYDFQLRTSSFVIEAFDLSIDDYVCYDVYYKIGICPISYDDSNPPTLDECIEALKSEYIFISLSQASGLYCPVFDFVEKGLSQGYYISHFDGVYVLEKQEYKNCEDDCSLKDKLILCHDNNKTFLCYFKLFYQDGTPVNEYIRYYSFIGYRNSNGDYVEAFPLYLTLTEQNMDGGFIRTELPYDPYYME